ncbi:MAG: hypothetical protein U0640_07760 [Phycisphaerales bacterium]
MNDHPAKELYEAALTLHLRVDTHLFLRAFTPSEASQASLDYVRRSLKLSFTKDDAALDAVLDVELLDAEVNEVNKLDDLSDSQIFKSDSASVKVGSIASAMTPSDTEPEMGRMGSLSDYCDRLEVPPLTSAVRVSLPDTSVHSPGQVVANTGNQTISNDDTTTSPTLAPNSGVSHSREATPWKFLTAKDLPSDFEWKISADNMMINYRQSVFNTEMPRYVILSKNPMPVTDAQVLGQVAKSEYMAALRDPDGPAAGLLRLIRPFLRKYKVERGTMNIDNDLDRYSFVDFEAAFPD